jgi:hypothetical protein
MMKRIVFAALALTFTLDSTAQEVDSLPKKQEIIPTFAKKLNIDLFFRGGGISDSYTDDSKNSTHFVIDNARLNLQGDFNEDLFYRVRFRPNLPFNATTQDGGTSALDYAFLTYRFGSDRQWDVTVGKQLAAFGAFEKEINPLYEYIFTDYLNGVYNNVFLSGLTLGYKINRVHKIGVQLHNTVNTKFADLLKTKGFVAGDFKASKAPIGMYLFWNADLLDGKLKLRYSYNLSQYAANNLTHSLALGNWYKSGRHTLYLDLSYTYMGADYGLTTSQLLSAYDGLAKGIMQKDAVYKRAVSRYDYQLTDRWSLSAKLGIEQAGSTQRLSEQLRTNYIYFAAAQYAPLRGQDLRFYLAYVGNTISYDKTLHLKDEQMHRIAIGAYYTLPILKTNN